MICEHCGLIAPHHSATCSIRPSAQDPTDMETFGPLEDESVEERAKEIREEQGITKDDWDKIPDVSMLKEKCPLCFLTDNEHAIWCSSYPKNKSEPIKWDIEERVLYNEAGDATVTEVMVCSECRTDQENIKLNGHLDSCIHYIGTPADEGEAAARFDTTEDADKALADVIAMDAEKDGAALKAELPMIESVLFDSQSPHGVIIKPDQDSDVFDISLKSDQDPLTVYDIEGIPRELTKGAIRKAIGELIVVEDEDGEPMVVPESEVRKSVLPKEEFMLHMKHIHECIEVLGEHIMGTDICEDRIHRQLLLTEVMQWAVELQRREMESK